jgi:hypothetical protein
MYINQINSLNVNPFLMQVKGEGSTIKLLTKYFVTLQIGLKGIVSRDFVVCFLVSFNRSDISTHQERVLLLLKVRFRVRP